MRSWVLLCLHQVLGRWCYGLNGYYDDDDDGQVLGLRLEALPFAGTIACREHMCTPTNTGMVY